MVDVAPVTAQSPSSAAGSVLPRADFSFSFAELVAADPRFEWIGQVGFDLDVFDYPTGRVRFSGDYQATIGRERRRYDLNQGHYSFDASASTRVGATEISGLVRHVSRHLTDRQNPVAISWNEVGARVEHRHAGLAIDVEVGRAMQQAFVDYAWTSRAKITARHPVGKNVELIASGSGALIGVNAALNDRDRLCGGRIEGGLRLNGHAAAIELFAGYERRIDAFPTDRFRVRWFTTGFRVVSR